MIQEVLSVEKCRSIDNYTINDIGMPSILLMENAAQQIFEKVVSKGQKFTIFCGVGNNGGDGLAIARKLILSQKQVEVIIIGNIEKGTEEFKINYRILENMNVNMKLLDRSNIRMQLEDTDVIIDSIFGIGLNRELSGDICTLVNEINKSGKHIISVDLPSGINGDTGEIMGIAINAEETYTVEIYKKGFFENSAIGSIGNVEVINIGVSNNTKEKFSENIFVYDQEYYKKLIPMRSKYGHKGNYGRVLILAGSKGYTGAAYLTAQSAIKSGAGLVTLVVNQNIQHILAQKLTEAMTITYDDKRVEKLIEEADSIVCGPGLGTAQEAVQMLKLCINKSKCPILIDADAINILSKDNTMIDKLKNRAVFTPHPGEMSRLLNCDIDKVLKSRMNTCIKYAKDNNVTVLLKGFNTIISDGNVTNINMTGSSKMASGGMGDCLSGIIGSFMAQGIGIYKSAVLGAYVHGLTGDMLGKTQYTIVATDIIEEIPRVINDIVNDIVK